MRRIIKHSQLSIGNLSVIDLQCVMQRRTSKTAKHMVFVVDLVHFVCVSENIFHGSLYVYF